MRKVRGLVLTGFVRGAIFESRDYGLGGGVAGVNDSSHFDVIGVNPFKFVECRLHSLHALGSIHARHGQDRGLGIGIEGVVRGGGVGGLGRVFVIATQ